MLRRSKILLVVTLAALCVSAFALLASSAAPVTIPSINDDVKNSPLGARHWNIFRSTVNNPADPEQNHCIGCHSAVKMIDDPNAQLTDFLTKGQKYATGEKEVNGQTVFEYDTAKETGKYADNDFEGITCRVCHVMDKNGLTLRRPDNTCTQCHGRVFNWAKGSGHHVEQDFIEGHGETTWSPSVHYTLKMQCQDCHTMNSIKHDYEPAKPEDIVVTASCMNCHKDAAEMKEMIETTQTKVVAALKDIDARVKAGQALVDAKKVDANGAALIKKAKGRSAFITSDFSNGVHNPQFAAQLINEANAALDEFDKLAGKATKTATFALNLTTYSQAQTSALGNRHWDMLERTVTNMDDPDQSKCIGCHSAVTIVDDPKATIPDFLAKGQKYCTEELENAPAGQSPFVFGTTDKDGKYVKNRLEGITCRVCHTFGKDGNIALRKTEEQTCGQCHGRSFKWATGSGKHVELAFFKGQGDKTKGIDVKDMPSMKVSMGFNCQDCHFMDNTKHDYVPATPAQIAANPKCSSCHTAAQVEGMIKGIQDEVKARIAKLQPQMDKAKAYCDKNPRNKKALDAYTQIKAGISFINNDMSNGVHNPAFAKALLDRSEKLMAKFNKTYKIR